MSILCDDKGSKNVKSYKIKKISKKELTSRERHGIIIKLSERNEQSA